MQNITVIALKKGKVVENHTCTFESNQSVLNHYPTYDGYRIYNTEIDTKIVELCTYICMLGLM